MRILAISGSLRDSSTNTILIHVLTRLAPTDMEISIYKGLADLPHFSTDLDDSNTSKTVHTLRTMLQEADGVIISTPEYAFGVPGSLKNALDWTVSTGDLAGKPVAVISASSLWEGGNKAHASLMLTMKALGANVPEAGTLMIPTINKKLSTSGEVLDPTLAQELSSVLTALAQTITAQRTEEYTS